MENKSILCDSCGKELVVDSKYPHHFSFELKCIDTGINTSDMVFAIAQSPPLDRPHHFCNTYCIQHWITDLQKSILDDVKITISSQPITSSTVSKKHE